MKKRYIVRVPKKQMESVGDMLRYDDCFQVGVDAEEYVCSLLSFTPERWRSFGFVPVNVVSYSLSTSEERRLSEKAAGFTEGVRFAQKLLGGSIMQSR